MYEKKDHTITLNYTHRPSRHAEQDKVVLIRSALLLVKEKIVQNLVDNVDDQNQKGTIVEFASAFDLSRKYDKSTRVSHLKQLYLLYGQEYTHTIPGQAKDSLEDYTITIRYPPKLKCTESELVTEFNSLWPVLCKTWLKFKDSKPSATRMRRFWDHVLEEHAIDYPNMSDLLLILLSISPGTGPLERSFSKLSKICYKDRGCISAECLETLYLLSTLAIKEDDDLFPKTRDSLQKKGYKMN